MTPAGLRRATHRRGPIRFLPLLLAVSALISGACGDRRSEPTASTGTAFEGVLASVARAEGTAISGIGSTRVEFFDRMGRVTLSMPVHTFRYSAKVVRGAARAVRTTSVGSNQSTKLDPLAEGLAASLPYLAIARGKKGRMMTGFQEASVEGSNYFDEVIGTPGPNGEPVNEMQFRRDGQLVARFDLGWRSQDGGYVLESLVSELFIGGVLYASMATDFGGQQELSGLSLPQRSGRLVAQFAADALFPGALHAAMGCLSSVLTAIGGFGALLGTAPAVVTPPTAVVWLSGWVAWTGAVIQAVEDCDEPE